LGKFDIRARVPESPYLSFVLFPEMIKGAIYKHGNIIGIKALLY
jgi:hypothetical protein